MCCLWYYISVMATMHDWQGKYTSETPCCAPYCDNTGIKAFTYQEQQIVNTIPIVKHNNDDITNVSIYERYASVLPTGFMSSVEF